MKTKLLAAVAEITENAEKHFDDFVPLGFDTWTLKQKRDYLRLMHQYLAAVTAVVDAEEFAVQKKQIEETRFFAE